MKVKQSLRYTLAAAALVSAAAITLPNAAFAGRDYKGMCKADSCKMRKSPWYVSANIGMSHLFDEKIPGSTNSVNQNGPGWNVNAGYNFTRYYGAEIGFNQYHDSRETAGLTEVATTEHYSAYLAGTGRYCFQNRISAIGKLGLAYSYANKVVNGASGASAGANSLSLYYGVGLAYKLTKRTKAALQWSRALGNDVTGSADLYSVGFIFSI